MLNLHICTDPRSGTMHGKGIEGAGNVSLARNSPKQGQQHSAPSVVSGHSRTFPVCGILYPHLRKADSMTIQT